MFAALRKSDKQRDSDVMTFFVEKIYYAQSIIIIPIYNVEKYIERCARSLFEQTEEDLEFIFVNDGTPDNSMQILNDVIRDYPSRKDQIKIFENEKNLGLPLTRQRGLKEATGEYIIHCYSDDWVDTNMYQILYEEATDLDIVWRDFYRTDGVTNKHDIQNTNTDKVTILKDILIGKKLSTLWNHLVKRSLVLSMIILNLSLISLRIWY